MNNEPVAWAFMLDGDFWDAIHPDEHAQEEGSYDIPLYTRPVKELILTNEKILEVIKELEHSICFSESLGFFELKEFAEAILKKTQEVNNEQVPDFFFMENDLMGKR